MMGKEERFFEKKKEKNDRAVWDVKVFSLQSENAFSVVKVILDIVVVGCLCDIHGGDGGKRKEKR